MKVSIDEGLDRPKRKTRHTWHSRTAGCAPSRKAGALACAVLTALLVIAPAPLAAEIFKLATLAPEGSPWHDAVRDIAEDWRELSGGRIEVRVYGGGVAGDDAAVVRKMRIGQIHAAMLTSEGIAHITPDILALQVPMMLTSNAELDYVREKIAPRIEASLMAQGFKLLAWGDVGWVRFFTKSPVVTPEDLKPKKLFTWAEGGSFEMWRKMGYQPVSVPVPEIHMALQTGMIDALLTAPIAALSNQWFMLAPHMTNIRLAPFVGAIVISMDAWSKVPDDLKTAFETTAREHGARLVSRVRAFEDEAIEVMKSHGLVIHEVAPETAALWDAEARDGYPVMFRWGVPEDTVREVERFRDEFRASRSGS